MSIERRKCTGIPLTTAGRRDILLPRVNELLAIGRLPTGTHSAITDVPEVRVGHASIDQGRLHTGVTAVLPHGRDLYRDKVSAAAAVLNGDGKCIRLMQ